MKLDQMCLPIHNEFKTIFLIIENINYKII